MATQSSLSGRLKWWRDITPCGDRLRSTTLSSPHVLVVSGGVTGLITSWAMLDRGYRVTIISKEWASFGRQQRLTSQIAGALWKYPPAVCGQHTDAISLEYSKRWAMIAYHIFDQLALDPELALASGVSIKPATFFFHRPVEEDAAQLRNMEEIMASGVRGFARSPIS